MTAEISLRPTVPEDREWVNKLMDEGWAASFVVVRGQSFIPANLPGIIAMVSGERVGLATYRIEGHWCEVVTLNSLQEGIGVGTALLDAVKQAALNAGCQRLSVITTNDNLHALRFYQRHGWQITTVYPGAVDRTRKTLKPDISPIGENGIPLRDEIELDMPLGG